MKRRFLAAFALGCALASSVPARAEQPLDAPRREKVRQLLEEGSTLEGKGDLQRAYVAYLAGWGLEHHFAVAANLGAVELQLGKPRDAAEHLTFALRAFPQGKYPTQRAVVEEKLREASKRVARLELQVDKPGADVLVDGKLIGQSPLVDAIFVEPGTHKIEARLGGKTDSRSSTATAGGTEQIKLGVGESQLATTSATTSTVPTVTSEAPAKSSSPSLAPVIVGGAVAVVGLAAGIGFRLSASSKASERDDLLASIAGTAPCGANTQAPDQCSRAADLNDERIRARNISNVGFIAFGVSAAATLAYVLYPRDGTTAAVRVLPALSHQTAGLSFQSDF